MTFKYGLAVPITGPHKIRRFKSWVGAMLPDLAYNLPVQAPVDASTMTVRLRSSADKARLEAALPALLP